MCEKKPFNPIRQCMRDLKVMEEMDEEEEASLRGNTKPIEIGMIVYDRQLGVCQVKTMSPDSQWATVWSQEKSNLADMRETSKLVPNPHGFKPGMIAYDTVAKMFSAIETILYDGFVGLSDSEGDGGQNIELLLPTDQAPAGTPPYRASPLSSPPSKKALATASKGVEAARINPELN